MLFNLKEKIEEKQTLELEIEKLKKEKEQLIYDNNTLQSSITNLDYSLKNRENLYISTELKYIDTLSGIEFETYCTDLLTKNGYNAITTKPSGDEGADIIATKYDIQYVIQCKNYSSTVGNKAVQEVYAAKGIYNCDEAIVLTNNFFTRQAISEANILNIKLWDRNSLQELLYTAYNFTLSNIDITSSEVQNKINDNDEFSSLFKSEQDHSYLDKADPLLMEAIEEVIYSGQASTLYIQRKFKVGMARAGRIIDQMEERGIISGYQGSKPRQVLMSIERWKELKENK